MFVAFDFDTRHRIEIEPHSLRVYSYSQRKPASERTPRNRYLYRILKSRVFIYTHTHTYIYIYIHIHIYKSFVIQHTQRIEIKGNSQMIIIIAPACLRNTLVSFARCTQAVRAMNRNYCATLSKGKGAAGRRNILIVKAALVRRGMRGVLKVFVVE